MCVQLKYIMIQNRQTMKKQEFFYKYHIKRLDILLLRYMYQYMYLLYQGMYILQILHTASLVGQD